MPRKLEPNYEPISGYRLKKYLGRGGFGEVWETEAPGGLSKAIKLAPMELTDDNVQCRELDGLQKIKSIRHPYLLSIERFEFVDDGYLVIVMELADESLEDRLRHHQAKGEPGIPRNEVLRYMREAAEVLDVMNNQHGLQHMDVKPGNLFLSSGHVKVADFGLVQPRNTNMSVAALAVSPPYAPPELFDGRVDASADQYSLAVTYQELVTGSRPYSATDVRGLIMQHLRGRPNLSMLSPADRPVVTKALQRDSTKRFASCSEFIDALIDAPTFSDALRAEPTEEAATEAVESGEAAGKAVETEKGTGAAQPERAKPRFVIHKPSRDAGKIDTAPIGSRNKSPTTPAPEVSPDDVSQSNKVRSTFVAFLPLEIYAHKLRGFIDAMDAEIISCTDEKAVLRFLGRRGGWFGLGSARNIFMELDSYSSQPNSGVRVVDATIWSSSGHLVGDELGRRGHLLIHCLKGHLMATDSSGFRSLKKDSEIREEILG